MGQIVSVLRFLECFRLRVDLGVSRVGSAEVEYLEIQSADGRQCVPAWMLDADCCAQMTCGLQPTVDLSSLMELADWLRALDL